LVDFAATDVAVALLEVASTTTTPTIAEGTLILSMVLSPAVEILVVVLVLPPGAVIATIFFDALHFDEQVFMII
jgi:hypothetical protein